MGDGAWMLPWGCVMAGEVVVAVLLWAAWPPASAAGTKPPPMDAVDEELTEIELTLLAGRDYHTDRLHVRREMPGVWTASLDGRVLQRTIRSALAAREVLEPAMRARRPVRAVGHPRQRRGGARDWRRDLAP